MVKFRIALLSFLLASLPAEAAFYPQTTVVQPTGTNLHVVVDSAPSTAVSGTVTANIGTTNGLALDATLSSMSAKLPATLGQKTMANSMACVLPSDQSAIPVTGTFWQATQPVSAASLPLPTGAATSALQTTGNTSLSSIDGKLGSLGQKAMSGSAPVVLASDQSAVPTKAAVNANGSGSAAASTVSTVITLTAPANAVGFILQNLDTSTANIRWAVGRTASTTLGQQLQPGRDTGFIPVGANVSLVAESGTQNYDVQWVSQ
jgi:hypothetical protein